MWNMKINALDCNSTSADEFKLTVKNKPPHVKVSLKNSTAFIGQTWNYEEIDLSKVFGDYEND